jgi:D-erythro-7,8-dihydroneopterin triphosphate epimerase
VSERVRTGSTRVSNLMIYSTQAYKRLGMVDRIFIERLRLRCKIGVTEEERRDPQEVIVDVNMFLDLQRATDTGDLKDTVNYREVREIIADFVSKGEFTLLEALAGGIASLCLKSARVGRVTVRVRKGKYSEEPSIGIEIDRTRRADAEPWSKR